SSACPVLLFTAPATPDTHPLSLHDALPIYPAPEGTPDAPAPAAGAGPARKKSAPARTPAAAATRTPAAPRKRVAAPTAASKPARSEEHTSELQSRENLVCRLLLEKKKNTHA